VAKQRLFFGLLPDRETHKKLIELAMSFPIIKGVRPVPKDNLHITLQFLGYLEANERKCLEKKMVQTFVQSFSLRFDLYGYFKTSQTLWLGCSSYPAELTRLVNHLKSIGESCGAKMDKRVYKPHITLFRKVPSADFPNIPFTITWRATEFHLLESVPNENTTRYNVLKTHSFLEE
jgi:2'-5' RNA ligase